MALDAPNCFNEGDFRRMRTPSQPYDARVDYSRLIAQLKESCREFKYLGISPQNLIEPAELSPVIVIPYYDKPMRAFVDPHIVHASGGRVQVEGCANIRLVRNGRKFPPYVKTLRPTHIVLSHMVDGRRVTTTYRDRRPQASMNIGTVAVLCHEIHHTKGKLLADLARQRLLNIRDVLAREVKKDSAVSNWLRVSADWESPRALLRDNDRYVLRLASEFGAGNVPPVSPDALYADIFFIRRKQDLAKTFVPREGELLPIVPSDAFCSLVYGT